MPNPDKEPSLGPLKKRINFQINVDVITNKDQHVEEGGNDDEEEVLSRTIIDFSKVKKVKITVSSESESKFINVDYWLPDAEDEYYDSDSDSGLCTEVT